MSLKKWFVINLFLNLSIAYAAEVAEEVLADCLIKQVEYRQIYCVKELLKIPFDRNMQNKRGHIALIQAAKEGDLAIVQVLLSAGASPNVQDLRQDTPLIEATLQGGSQKKTQQAEIVEELLRAKALLDTKNSIGCTALFAAVVQTKIDSVIIQKLLMAKADVNARDSSGRTPLMAACQRLNYRSINTLLDAKADINSQDFNGCTALMHAIKVPYFCYWEDRKILLTTIITLLAAGADINLSGKEGTAIQMIDIWSFGH